MTLLWIPFTIFAAFMQSWRNALQKQLRNHASTLGVTLARFIVALPLAGIYVWLIYQTSPQEPSLQISAVFLVNVAIAAFAQIAATAFMVMLFKTKNYAIGVGLAKSEAVIAAALGALFFAAPLSLMAWLGVFMGAVAVWLMSLNKNKGNNPLLTNEHNGLSWQTIGIGVASGLCFALCTLYIREAALILRSQVGMGFLISAAWVLFLVISTQTVLLTLWLAIKEPKTLNILFQHKKLTASVSFFSFFGSIGWFTAMSLQTVAMVKTLGQIEVLFTLAISAWWFKETLTKTDYIGLLFIVIGAMLVVLG